MPKVKFLKDLCSGRAGSVQNLQDYEARVLIQLGAAVLHEDPKENNQQIVPILMNLNETPVIDDFGEMVEANIVIESPVKKALNQGKGERYGFFKQYIS